MKVRTKFVKFALIAPLAFGMIGSMAVSASSQDSTPGATPASDMGICSEALHIGMAGDSCINVVHASPDAPAVDVYLDGTKALSDLAFGSFSGWVAVPSGKHQVQVAAAGSDVSTAVIDAEVELSPDAAYEVAAVGNLAEIKPAVFQVDLSDVGTATDAMSRIRVIHASPDAPAVDIALKGGDVLIGGLAFPDASDFLEVPAGSYDLEVRPAGTMDVALDLPGVALEGGMVYDVFAIGQLADGTLTVLVIPSTTAVAVMATPVA